MSITKWCILFLSVLFVLQGKARAEEILTTVFNVIESKKSQRILLLSGKDGRVYKYPKSERNLKYLKSFQGSVVRISYYKTDQESIISNIVRVRPGEANVDEMDLNHFRYNQLREFSPSDLRSDEKVHTVFDSMLNDGDKRRTECFKRAHIWAYDMWADLGLKTQKIFIFYTKRFIQLEDFEWWFHVAPMVVSNGVEYVLDGTFMEKAINIKEWQSYFIKSDKITCPVIEKYQDYEKNQWNRLCFLMKVPMYYFSPLDIQARDEKGIERNHWVIEELQDARRSFRGYSKTYEALDTGKPTIKF